MIVIKKLRSRNTVKLSRLESSIGIADFFFFDLPHYDQDHFWFCRPQIVRDKVLARLADNNIILSSEPANPYVLDQAEKLVRDQYGDHARIIYDVDMKDFFSLPPMLMRHIAATRELLFSDLTEGVPWIQGKGRPFSREHFKELKLSGNFHLLTSNLISHSKVDEYPDNTNILPPINSFETFTITNDLASHFLDLHHRTQHLNRIDQAYRKTPPKQFLVMFSKPKLQRLQILAQMYFHNILDRAEWSLGYYPDDSKKFSGEYVTRGHTLESENLNQGMSDLSYFEIEFLKTHGPWPKTIEGEPIGHNMIIGVPLDLVERASWKVVSETTVASRNDDMHESNFCMVSEKFYKSVILGMPAITISWQNCHRDIESFGYQLPDLDWSHLESESWYQRLGGTVELMKTLGDRNSFKQKALENFQRITDTNQLADSMVKPLLQLRKAPTR